MRSPDEPAVREVLRRQRQASLARPLLYSKSCQEALRAMERLARAAAASPDAWVSQREIAGAIGLSPASLAQILHRLRKSGLVTARRGPAGGVSLARPPEGITVLEVIRAIDGTGVGGRCVLGFDACTEDTPCPAHPVWAFVRGLLERELEGRSLLDLVKSVAQKKAKTRAGAARRGGHP